MLPRTRGLSRRPFLPEGRSFARDPSSMSIWAARVHNSPTRTSTSLLRLVVSFFPIFHSMRYDILWFQCKIDDFVMLSIMQLCSFHISLGRSSLIMENMTARAVVGGSLPLSSYSQMITSTSHSASMPLPQLLALPVRDIFIMLVALQREEQVKGGIG